MKLPKATKKIYFVLVVVLILGAVVLYGSCHFTSTKEGTDVGQDIRVTIEQILAQNTSENILETVGVYSYECSKDGADTAHIYVSAEGIAEENGDEKLVLDGSYSCVKDADGNYIVRQNEIENFDDVIKEYFYTGQDEQTIENTEHKDGNLIVTVANADGGKYIYTLDEKTLFIQQYELLDENGKVTYTLNAGYDNVEMPDFANELFLYLKDNEK